jgi:hypothetical protein
VSCPSVHPTKQVRGEALRCWHGVGHDGRHGNGATTWEDPETDRCSCDESLRLRGALVEVKRYLRDLGAGGHNVGPMNNDDGAHSLLATVEEALQ